MSANAPRTSLTPRQRRFVKEVLQDPSSFKEAAIRAGYSPTSAHVAAARLLRHPAVRSELAKHFVDAEGEVSQALMATLLRLRGMVEKGTDGKFLRAAKLLLEYSKLASGILGLEFKVREQQKGSTELDLAQHAQTDPEELLAQAKEEVRRLEELIRLRAQSH